MADDSKLKLVADAEHPSIKKPRGFSFDEFQSAGAGAANVETLLTALPHHNISAAKDFVRLHPDEEAYWSPELLFVNVPIKGQKRDTLHLIRRQVAIAEQVTSKVLYFRLALAAKPFDVFFLCQVPSRNEENTWNQSNLIACNTAKTLWVQATSQKEAGMEAYKIDTARDPDAFPEPRWPSQTLVELVEKTFEGRMIDRDDHPALARLVGAKPSMS
jgi:hypothetical protein